MNVWYTKNMINKDLYTISEIKAKKIALSESGTAQISDIFSRRICPTAILLILFILTYFSPKVKGFLLKLTKFYC